MILHIPHASRKLDGHIELDDEQANLDYLTDTGVREIFECSANAIIEFPLSRFVCDVERLKNNEPMDQIGQGVIYRKDVFGNNIRRITPDNKIYKMYNDHHRKLTLAVNRSLSLFRIITIVDCHTFPSNVSNVGVCIGTDVFHTPSNLRIMVVNHFEDIGMRVGINEPYGGAIIPTLHKNNEDVKSIMIDINKNVVNEQLYIESLMEKINEYEWSFE